MQFHVSSFLHQFESHLPLDMAWFYRNHIVFVFARFPVKLTFLRETLTETLCETLPETPPHTLLETLKETLETSDLYLTRQKHCPVGERQETVYEYQIDLTALRSIVNHVWLHSEMCQAWNLIQHDDFVSVRVLQSKLLMTTGKTYSLRRVNVILDALTQEGLLRNNGMMHTRGREVVK
jgi:hypothetical protein